MKAPAVEDSAAPDEAAAVNEMRDAFRKARAMQASPGKSQKSQRKTREKKVQSVVDGRSLRATGRTEQFNINMRPDLKSQVAERAKAEGITVTVWVERVFEAALDVRGN
jgi:predicted HicB family RNase H-like nuclease